MKYKKIITVIGLIALWMDASFAQENVYPAPPQLEAIYLIHAIIHVGNGQVINNGTIGFSKGKITIIGDNVSIPQNNVKVYDCKGSHVYPGLISSLGNIGLIEISSVKATNDFSEIGQLTPSVHSIVAYNTDSKVINTLRSNGILLAHIIPQGGFISGTSSVVQLDAWDWEGAIYKENCGIHFYMPKSRPTSVEADDEVSNINIQKALDGIQEVKAFLKEGKAYLSNDVHDEINVNYEALHELFQRKQKLFVHCDMVKEMLLAIDLGKELNIEIVIVGGADSWQIADLLKQNNIAVILNQPHSLPLMQDDDIDQPYKTAAQLQKAGVLFCFGIDGFWQQRNLMFNAGTTAAYGLTKEEALSAITNNPAKILGIDSKTGTLEVGKDANLIVSQGDLLDMAGSIVTKAYIEGREINLDDKHKQLYERYKHHYNIK